MFIDTSYFIGPLTIAQIGQKAVDDRLNDFINRYEPVIMEAALGYDFYQAFLEGLNVGSDEVIEQRWLDLLNGVAFTSVSEIRKRFPGFAGGQNTQTIIAAQRDDLFIYAGVTPGFAVDDYRYTNSDLKNWNYTLEQFGSGTWQPIVEWAYKSGGGWALTDTNYKLQYNERWVLHFTGKKTVVVPSGAQNLLSPLAGFIYYEYMKDLATQTTGIGVVKSKGENSESANPIKKMCYAYNDAVRQIQLLWELLQADQNKDVKVYPEFDPVQVIGYNYGCYRGWAYWFNYRGDELYSFRPINPFGI